MTDEDLDALAAEYVLGTLTAEERESVEQLAAKDSGFAGRLAAWERRLGTLEAMVEPVEPPAQVWANVRAKVAKVSPEAAMRLPEVTEPPGPTPSAAAPEASNVIDLTQRMRRWRGIAVVTGAAAAVLLLAIGVGRYRPDMLPPELRPPVEVRTVEVTKEVIKEVVREVEKPVPVSSGRFVAVLQRDAGSPAFLLTVDLDKRTLTARRVTATPEPGKSLELWLVHDRFPAPRSLGVVGANEFTQRATLASYDRDTINTATYAVSLEPEGGSPTGVPTGPVLFTGKLIESVPPTPSPQPLPRP